MKKLLYIVLAVAVVLGFKFYQKSKAGGEVKAQAMEQMQQQYAPLLGKDYVTELVNYAHPKAMDQAYKTGGRRKSSAFDADSYRVALHRQLAEKLAADGKGKMSALFGSGGQY